MELVTELGARRGRGGCLTFHGSSRSGGGEAGDVFTTLMVSPPNVDSTPYCTYRNPSDGSLCTSYRYLISVVPVTICPPQEKKSALLASTSVLLLTSAMSSPPRAPSWRRNFSLFARGVVLSLLSTMTGMRIGYISLSLARSEIL